jgi:hypothetical protein
MGLRNGTACRSGSIPGQRIQSCMSVVVIGIGDDVIGIDDDVIDAVCYALANMLERFQ